MLGLLYSAYELHTKADLSSDLVNWIKSKLEAARGAEQIYWQLALGYGVLLGATQHDPVLEMIV